MIHHKIATNFLKLVYSESIPDLANIIVAEAEDEYDVIINYLEDIRRATEKWIDELKDEQKCEI